MWNRFKMFFFQFFRGSVEKIWEVGGRDFKRVFSIIFLKIFWKGIFLKFLQCNIALIVVPLNNNKIFIHTSPLIFTRIRFLFKSRKLDKWLSKKCASGGFSWARKNKSHHPLSLSVLGDRINLTGRKGWMHPKNKLLRNFVFRKKVTKKVYFLNKFK